jgi:hypothetical protein
MLAFAVGALIVAVVEGGPLVASPRPAASWSRTPSRRSTEKRRSCRASGRHRRTAVGDARRGSGMAVARGIVQAIPTSKETK